MIPFDKIDEALKKLGKNRSWLAQVTGRSDHSIRSALAPNAAPKSRSALIQKALTDAIEREVLRRKAEAEAVAEPELKKVIILEPTVDEYRLWSEAFKNSTHSTLEGWAKAALNRAAKDGVRPKLSFVAEDPAEYGAKRRPK